MLRRRVVPTEVGPVVLADDEELVSVQECPVTPPAVVEPAMVVLARMAGVTHPDHIGAAGPVLAAAANPENLAVAELRRYEALFARDALYSAAFLREQYPELEASTVSRLAALQADTYCAASQAEPGKVPNHVRDPDDPLARALTRERGRVWPWFGGTDTTVLFLLSAVQVLRRSPHTADAPLTYGGAAVLRWGRPHTLRRAVAAAARWLLTHLGSGPVRGLLWVPLNDADSFTVWTDSPNAFSHADGTLVTPPVAPIGLQGQVYDALTALAHLAGGQHGVGGLRLGDDVSAARLRTAAEEVRRTVLARYLSPDPSIPVASALDGRAARPVCSTTVDVGASLDSGLWDTTTAHRTRDDVVNAMLGPTMLTPFGISGRAQDDVRWTPFDYHSQVWGFATHVVSRGLRHHGFLHEAADLDRRLLRQTDGGLLPENVGSRGSEHLELCQRIVTVRRPAPGGRMTVSVKERPPAPYAAWTAAAVVAVQGGRGSGMTSGRRPPDG